MNVASRWKPGGWAMVCLSTCGVHHPGLPRLHCMACNPRSWLSSRVERRRPNSLHLWSGNTDTTIPLCGGYASCCRRPSVCFYLPTCPAYSQLNYLRNPSVQMHISRRICIVVSWYPSEEHSQPKDNHPVLKKSLLSDIAPCLAFRTARIQSSHSDSLQLTTI